MKFAVNASLWAVVVGAQFLAFGDFNGALRLGWIGGRGAG